MGTYSKDREKKLSCLTEFNLNIWGDPRWFDSSLKRFVRGGRIHQDKMKKIIQKSLLNINIHYNAPREGANLRTFETTGCGGFLLTDYVRALENLFKIDRDIVCYSSLREMKSKVRYFLKNDKRRNKIALQGYKRSKKNHDYSKRVKQLLNHI